MKGSGYHPEDEGPRRLPPLSAVECFVQCRTGTPDAGLRTPDRLAGDAPGAEAPPRDRMPLVGTGGLLVWLWARPAAAARMLGLAPARGVPPAE